MNHADKLSVFRRCALLGVTLTAGAFGALLAGCRGNTTAAATVDHPAGAPPIVQAQRALRDLTAVDPLTSAVWQGAAWHTLVAPINSTRLPPPSRAAVLFDASRLYVAVVCEQPRGGESRDAVSLYLDPTGQGRELLQITTDSTGQTQCTWIRAGAPVQPQENGAPNTGYPLDLRPDFRVEGLAAHVRSATSDDGRSVWTLSLTVPVAGLPALMQVAPTVQNPWKFNLLRTLTSGDDQLQSNLSPVYVNAQAFSPYRLAKLEFAAN